jgi:hypothetical protein
MPDERPLPARLLDLAVYAPVGIVLTIAEDLPELADKGRERVTRQLDVARVIGRFAVQQAERFAEHRGIIPGKRSDRPDSGIAPKPPEDASSPVSAHRDILTPAAGAPAPSRAFTGESTVPHGPTAEAPRHVAAPKPDVTSLPIAGYDTLAASQVVQRLSSLRRDELDAIRRYEIATRGRRTILNRIGQLEASGENGQRPS